MSTLQECLDFERRSEFSKALNGYFHLMKENEGNLGLSLLYENFSNFLSERIACRASLDNLDIRPLYVGEHNPTNYSFSGESMNGRLPSPIVSFTAISTRLDRVIKTVSTLTRQSLKPQSINLYVSTDSYLIDEGVDAGDNRLKKIYELGVNIYLVKNIGPYRKQYPVIKQLMDSKAHPMTPIVTVDDDVLYPRTILEDLVRNCVYSQSVVAHRGRKISRESVSSGYKSFSVPSEITSHFNLGTGRNGIAYLFGFFPKNSRYYVGPQVAPTADDLWCKWVTLRNRVPTTILEPEAAYDPTKDFEDTAPNEKVGLFHNYNAKGMNDQSLISLERFFSSFNESASDFLMDGSAW